MAGCRTPHGRAGPDDADTQQAAESSRNNTEHKNQGPGFLSHEFVISLSPSHMICKTRSFEQVIPNVFLAPGFNVSLHLLFLKK